MKKLFSIITFVLLFIGCTNINNEDKVAQNEPDTNGSAIEPIIESPIVNEWSLIKFEPGFSPTKNFKEKEIVWTFLENGTLKVETSLSNSLPIKSIGVYGFSLREKQIVFGETGYDFELKNESLIISDDPSSDGFRATFYKTGD